MYNYSIVNYYFTNNTDPGVTYVIINPAYLFLAALMATEHKKIADLFPPSWVRRYLVERMYGYQA